jgi:hypothetical protein
MGLKKSAQYLLAWPRLAGRSFFPCGPLELEEYNLDYKRLGSLLPTFRHSGEAGSDIIATLMR